MNDPNWKTMSNPDLTAVGTDDRRAEPRFQASGDVRLHIVGPQPVSIPGRILDVSQHGMRVKHMYPALHSGALLEIESGTQRYTARVVWNCIKDDGVESGFYLL
jgi:hypothetical protein